ncbi:S-layer homology domain-containing protein [Peptoniphilus genitalis]|uniref:S-layer homology domain-containing protein n=1 Tax=Peptoniphilus genitalis TaxID=3036303 RepID=UPI0024AE293F|nr:S-layer homology domain-containing protein [Peptoniphilus sp. Marseille-Q7072]
MEKLKRIISALLSLIMVMGTITFPSPTFAESNSKEFVEAEYKLEDIDGKSYKVYEFTDLTGKSISKNETNIDGLELSKPITMNAVRSSNPELGEEIPNAERYSVDIQWTTYDLKPEDIGTPVHFILWDKTTKTAIAQTEDVTQAGLADSKKDTPKGPTYKYKFKKLPGWDKEGVSHDTDNWQMRAPNEYRFDIRLKTGTSGNFSQENVSAEISQRGNPIYRAEYHTNKAIPTIEVQRTNVDDNTSKVPINNTNLTGNQYYSWAEAISSKQMPFFEGKLMDIQVYGYDSLESLQVSEPITAGRVKMAMKAPGKTEFDRGPGTFEDNGTPYHYEVTGDYKSLHIFTIRQDLKVKFDPNGGTWKGQAPADQTIGHSMKLGDSWAGLGPISVPGAGDLTPPEVAAGKPEKEFIGWNTDKDATSALFTDNTYAEPITADVTTFYAIYKEKAQGKINVEYQDMQGNPINAKYRLEGKEYPTELPGNNGEAIKAEHLNGAPEFLGYEYKANATRPVPSPGEKAGYTEDGKYTLIYKYDKLKSVIPEKDPNGGKDNTKPNGYVTVTFKAGKHGKINDDTKDVKFFVNPKDDVTFGDTKIAVPKIEAVGDYKVKTQNWNPDYEAKKTETITADAEFVAQYEAKAKHTVTFNADNGTENTTEKVVDGKTATKPATDPTKKGYTFKEWQLVTDGNVSGTAYDFGTAVKSDITLKAVYTENQVKIEYVSEDTNKGTVDKAEETIGAITGAPTGSTLGSTAKAMDGYRFTHWTKDGDNTFKVKTEKVTPEKTNEIYAAAKFTAHFAKEVSVKYDLNAPSGLTAKGTAPTDNTKYIAGEKADVKALPQGAGVDGCEFLGWSTDKSATTATYKANDKIDITGEKDVTLYGVWKKGTKTVNLTFEFYKKKDSGNVQQPENALGNFKKPELKNLTGQEVGAVITFPTYQGQTVNTGDLQGTWTFDGWYKNGVKVTGQQTVSATDADNQYVGKWILEETKTAKVSHVFKIDPSIVGDDKVVKSTHELPQGVKDQKRQDTTNYVGSIVNPISKPAFTAVEEKIGDKIGTWTFVEWDKDQLTVSATEADNVFTGTWTWTEKGKVNVNYVFEKTGTDRNLPKDITELKPTDLTGDKAVYEEQVQGKKPNLPATTSFDVVEDGNKVGTWTAGTWSNATKVDDNNYKYTLVWTFTEVGQSDQPTVDPVKPGDKKITGKGKAGSDIVVELPDGTKVPGKVDKNGDWTVEVPKDKDLKDGDKIKVTQKEKDKKTSKPVEVTVTEDKKPEPTPEPQPVPEVEIPGIKIRDHYTPTYPVYVSVPDKKDPVQDIFTHEQYIFGYPDDTIRPDGDMTRAEAIAVVARLQKLDLSDKTSNIYKDTKAGMWYNAAINAAFREGYLLEKEGENIRPNDKITRAELALLISHIDKKNDTVAPFEDVKGHKFEAAINQAYGNERIKGYPDGTFKPDNSITRAEVATMLNKLYDRYPDKNFIDANQNLVHNYKDMSYKGHWGYYELVEAYHTHKFARLANNMEEWKAIIK